MILSVLFNCINPAPSDHRKPTENKPTHQENRAKLENFVLGKSGKRDYDNLIFVSDLRPKELKGYTEEQIKENKTLQQIQAQYKAESEERRLMAHFGKMNLGTLEIQLNAVDFVKLSDEQNTTVFPEGSQVTVKKNRNFDFVG